MRRRLLLLSILLAACNHSIQHSSDPDLTPRRPEIAPVRGIHEAWIQDLFIPEDLRLGRPIQIGVNGWGFAPPWERFAGLGIEVNERKKAIKIRMLLSSGKKKKRNGVHMIYPATASICLKNPGTYTVFASRGDASASFVVRRQGGGGHPMVSTLAKLPDKAAPRGIACDPAGNLYVTDSYFHAVWKVSPEGTYFRLAGGGAGYRDGKGGKARFSFPSGIAVWNGEIFVADTGNHRIRKIHPDGRVSTLAGGGATGWFQGGFQAGDKKTARFNHPTGLAVDGAGTLFITDTDNLRVRMITPTGLVTTLLGEKEESSLRSPEGMALDPKGDLFIVDDAERIFKLSHGFLSSVQLHGRMRIGEINGLGCDKNGNLYVLDGQHKRIRQIAPDGTVKPVAGFFYFFQDGEGPIACFRDPSGIVVGPDGKLYVTDTGNGRIRKIS